MFDNQIFKELLLGKCVLNTDCAIAKDPAMQPWIKQYAFNELLFKSDYSKALTKLMETGQHLNELHKTELNVSMHSNLFEEGDFHDDLHDSGNESGHGAYGHHQHGDETEHDYNLYDQVSGGKHLSPYASVLLILFLL